MFVMDNSKRQTSVEKYVANRDDIDNETLLNELNATFGNQIDGEDPNNTLRLDTDHAAADADDDDDSDIFLLESKRKEQLAEERRIQRRKRLREIATSNSPVLASSTSTTTKTNIMMVDDNRTTTSKSNNDTNYHLQNELEPKMGVKAATKIKTDATVVSQQQSNRTDHPFPSNDTERNVEANHATNGDDDDDDEFDMFSSSVSPPSHLTTTTTNHDGNEPNNPPHFQPQNRNNSKNQQQDWDDSEGYYRAVIGETIDLMVHPSTNVTTTTTTTTATTTTTSSSTAVETTSLIRVRVAGLIGKGVFSTVLKCTVISNSTSIVLPNTIAMKCIRHNDSMTKTAITTELSILQKLRNSPGIVSLLLPTSSSSNSNSSNNNSSYMTPLEYRGHILFVFPCMEYNLRDVLQKFGKGIGISLPAVRSYFGQLLAALSHLHKFHIIHADIKPDNVLVSSDFAVIQIADFGSAMDLQSPDPSTNVTTQPTPYLVSRFYRAPEIILGLVPITHMIDLWSVAVTVAELYIGDVLFRGSSNNDMLYVFQQHLGPFANRMIRQHLIQCQKVGAGSTQLSPHFQLLPGTGNSYHFTQRTTDTVTGVPVLKVLSLVVTDTIMNSNSSNNHNAVKFPLGTPLSTKLLKAKSAKDTRKMVHQFIDLLTKCLLLDPGRRISLKDALRHEFFIVNAATNTTSGVIK